MDKNSAVVIAGGKNKRINMVKPLINLGGKQIIIRINEALKDIFSEIILVIRKNQSDDIPDLGMTLGMHIVEDIYSDIGPISGIYSGINESMNNKIFVIGGDYPFLSRELIFEMIQKSINNKSVFVKNKNIINPLHGIYIKNLWEEILLKNIKKNKFSTREIINENINNKNTHLLNYETFDNNFKNSLFDIDTLDDLKKAKKIIFSKKQTVRPDIRPEGL
ncbi:MAG: molybdenum cofactor guanylyltransferase [Chloroflexota bacterium]|jgi:molybdopterin-guanine dinucleotide biosynthesis protein A|nr:molybdenum cofactor guanylyltransferase [Chloroflexota bacterium]